MSRIIHGDCLEVMPTLDKVDMILADLPYGTTACKWDTVIPFEPLWENYKRLIKDNGAIVLFGSEPFSSLLRCSNLKMYKYDWVWHKNKSGNIFLYKISPMKRTENIMVFLNGNLRPQDVDKITFNHNAKQGNKVMKTVMKIHGIHGDRDDDKYKKYKGNTGYSDNLLKFNVDKDRIHSTQKPAALFE